MVRLAARRIAERMSFASGEAEQLERCISIEKDGPLRVLVFHSGDFRTDGPPFEADSCAEDIAEEFALNVAADLMEQRGRFGKTLPWQGR